jgi:hypothetical protein
MSVKQVFLNYFIGLVSKGDGQGNYRIGNNTFKSVAKKLNYYLNKSSYEYRKQLFESGEFNHLFEGIDKDNLPAITNGFVKINEPLNPVQGEFIKAGEEILKRGVKDGTYKDYFQILSDVLDYEWFPSLVEFATSKELLYIVANYLETIPVLKHIDIYASPPVDKDTFEGSQLFHMDLEDSRVARVIVLLDEVGDTEGPFTFFPSDLSKEAAEKLKYGSKGSTYRVTDEEMFKVVDHNKLLKATGSKGEIFICDTSNCFHYGSRGQTNPRKLAMLSFVTPAPENYHLIQKRKHRNALKKQIKDSDTELKKMVLDPEYVGTAK